MMEPRYGKYESIKKYPSRAQEIHDDNDPALENKFVKKFIKGLRDEQVKINFLITSSDMSYRAIKHALKGVCQVRVNSFYSEDSDSDDDNEIGHRKERKNRDTPTGTKSTELGDIGEGVRKTLKEVLEETQIQRWVIVDF
jgi:hypothetical protein